MPKPILQTVAGFILGISVVVGNICMPLFRKVQIMLHLHSQHIAPKKTTVPKPQTNPKTRRPFRRIQDRDKTQEKALAGEKAYTNFNPIIALNPKLGPKP